MVPNQWLHSIPKCLCCDDYDDDVYVAVGVMIDDLYQAVASPLYRTDIVIDSLQHSITSPSSNSISTAVDSGVMVSPSSKNRTGDKNLEVDYIM